METKTHQNEALQELGVSAVPEMRMIMHLGTYRGPSTLGSPKEKTLTGKSQILLLGLHHRRLPPDSFRG